MLDNDNLNEKEKIIIAYILKHDKITNSEIQNLLNISRGSALSLLNKLIEKEYLKKNGTHKSVHYSLIT
ncbi:MAG: winged helix-turn-helix transcriptional regulator [Fusobacteriaceae bacterium]